MIEAPKKWKHPLKQVTEYFKDEMEFYNFKKDLKGLLDIVELGHINIIKVKHSYVDYFELVHVLKLLYFPKISCEWQNFESILVSQN